MQFQICRKYAKYAQMKYAIYMFYMLVYTKNMQNHKYALYSYIHMHIYAKNMQKYAKLNMQKYAKNMHKYAKYVSMKFICILCTSHFADDGPCGAGSTARSRHGATDAMAS